MSNHCADNAADRAKGAFWEQQWAVMAKGFGHTFTMHQYAAKVAAFADGPRGRLVLPDSSIWSGAGQHHEIKHKSPTRKRTFGLEVYRLEHLLAFESITAEPVYYTIHNWELAGGSDVRINRIEHWVTCAVCDLYNNRGTPEWGPSYVNGEEKTVQLLYWPVAYFRPLLTLWRREAGVEKSITQGEVL